MYRIQIEITRALEMALYMEGIQPENALRAGLISLPEVGPIGFSESEFRTISLEFSFYKILLEKSREYDMHPSRMAGIYIFEFFYLLYKRNL